MSASSSSTGFLGVTGMLNSWERNGVLLHISGNNVMFSASLLVLNDRLPTPSRLVRLFRLVPALDVPVTSGASITCTV